MVGPNQSGYSPGVHGLNFLSSKIVVPLKELKEQEVTHENDRDTRGHDS
jgi:hypothetical protein